jgi:DNA-binding transcriptional MerR regulator
MSTSAALPELTGHDDADLLIGDVARHSGLSIDTLRYYDRAGLLGAVNRDGGGRRVFDRDTLGLLDVVLRLRRTGMPVEEVRHFVDLVRSGDTERALPSQDQVMAGMRRLAVPPGPPQTPGRTRHHPTRAGRGRPAGARSRPPCGAPVRAGHSR